MAKALINLHCSSEGTMKRRRIQSLVKTGAKPADLPKLPGLRLTVPMADAPKDPVLMTTAAQSVLAVGVEEGEILVGEMLMSLKGGEVPSGSFAPPSD